MEFLFFIMEILEESFSTIKLFFSIYFSMGALFIISVLILTSENIRDKFHIK